MIGQTLEHYRIDAKLGQGGMGVVYKARDTRLERPVAIKLLAPDQLGDPARTQRFVQEARAASALNHPGIVTIHDVRFGAGTDFIVMEYVEGQTLERLIPPRGLRVPDALRYGAGVADALAAAHAAGIIHRDLKPSNIMVTAAGRVKVLDFGLAKLLHPPVTSPDAHTVAAAVTAQGTLLGTTAYMSPEQAEGRTIDPRSDIFSFGSVLYEMLTGRRPFAGDTELQVLTGILRDDPPAPSRLVPSIPPELEGIALRCLRKDPARRFQSMADLKAALEDQAIESGSGPGVGPAARRHPVARWTIPAVAGAVLIGVAVLAWRASRGGDTREPPRAAALTTMPGAELYPSLSPDGDRVVFTATGGKGGVSHLYVQQIGAAEPVRLTADSRSDFNPVWSPDGQWIAFLRGRAARPLARSERDVRLIPSLGGPERLLAAVRVQEITVNPVFLGWSRDSRSVIVTDSTGDEKPDALFTISLETLEKKPLTRPQPPALADTDPAVSPDGGSLLFLRRSTWARGELHVMPLSRDGSASGDPRRIDAGSLKVDNAAWLPDGTEILVSAGASAGAGLWRIAASGRAPPSRLPYVGEDGILPAVSNGAAGKAPRLVYVRSFTDENIWRVDAPAPGAPAPSSPVVAIASTKADIHPQISPDGKRVAFTSTRSGDWEIWVTDLDGASAVQLTSLRAATGTGVPRWSADGTQIVFASDAEGQFDIFVVRSGGGRPRNLTSHPAFDHVPSFSRDGKWVYFASSRSGQNQIWKAPAAGGEATQVTRDGGWVSFESPDGRYLYYSATVAIGEALPLWRLPTAGGEPERIIDGVRDSNFQVVDRGIYYVDQPAGEPRLQFLDLSGSGGVVMVVRSLGLLSGAGGFAASADGRTILYGRLDSAVDDLMLVDNFR